MIFSDDKEGKPKNAVRKHGQLFFVSKGKDPAEDYQQVYVGSHCYFSFKVRNDTTSTSHKGGNSTEAVQQQPEPQQDTTIAHGSTFNASLPNVCLPNVNGNDEHILSKAEYVVLRNCFQSKHLIALLKHWQLDDYYFIPLYRTEYRGWERLLDKLVSAIKNVKKNESKVACLIFSDKPCSAKGIKMIDNECPCIQILCSGDDKIRRKTLKNIGGTKQLKKIDLNVNFHGDQLDYHTASSETRYSHYIMAEVATEDLVSKLTMSDSAFKLLPWIDYYFKFAQDNILHSSEHHVQDGLRFSYTTNGSAQGMTKQTETIPILSLTEQTLYLWLIEKLGKHDTFNKILSDNDHDTLRYKSLSKIGVLFHESGCRQKKYCIMQINNERQDLPPFLTADLPEYDKLIVIYMHEKERQATQYMYTVIRDLIGSIKEKVLFLICDTNGILLQADQSPDACSNACDVLDTAKSRCIGIIPLDKIRENGHHRESWPQGNVVEKFPEYDYNIFTDTYIFVDSVEKPVDSLSFYQWFQNKFSENTKANVNVIWLQVQSNVNNSSEFTLKLSDKFKDGSFAYGIKPSRETETLKNKFLCDLILACTDPTFGDLGAEDIHRQVEKIEWSKPESRNFKSSLLYKMFWSLISRAFQWAENPQLNDEEGKAWASSVSRILNNILRISDVSTDLKVDCVIYYLSCRDPCCKRIKSVLEHPGTKNVFTEAAEAVIRVIGSSERDNRLTDRIQTIIDMYPDDPVTSLCPVLAHLGRMTDTAVLLKSADRKHLVPYILYTVGIFKNELDNSFLENNCAFPTAEDHESLRDCTEDLESLATLMVRDVYIQNNKWSRKILKQDCDQYIGLNSIELAYMAKSKPFLSSPAYRAGLNAIWWRNLAASPLWKIVLFMLVPCLSQEISPNSKDKTVNCNSIYNTPGVNGIFQYLFFITFLMLYSHVALTGFKLNIEVIEYIILGWVVTFIIEEVRQMIRTFTRSSGFDVCKKVTNYIRNFWNMLDMIGFTLYFLAFVLRVIAYVSNAKQYLSLAHVIFSVNAIILYMRSLQWLAMHRKIGPLMVMVGYMCRDLSYFMVIMLVAMIGYGVALQSILYPHSPLSWTLIEDIIQTPYLQIYGEFDVDGILGAVSNGTGDVYFAEPRLRNYFGLVLAGIYLLFTNILLINLLIALFNSSYERVGQESEYYNLRQMNEFLIEYENKSKIPPPLVVFTYPQAIVRAIKSCKRKCNSQNGENHKVEVPPDVPKSQRGERTEQETKRKRISDTIKDRFQHSIRKHEKSKECTDNEQSKLFREMLEQESLKQAQKQEQLLFSYMKQLSTEIKSIQNMSTQASKHHEGNREEIGN